MNVVFAMTGLRAGQMSDSKVVLLKPSTAHSWRYRCADGEVYVTIPDGRPLTVERANILLDYAKAGLLEKKDS